MPRRLDAMQAEQDFSIQILDDHTLTRILAAAGFRGLTVLTAERRWVVTTAA